MTFPSDYSKKKKIPKTTWVILLLLPILMYAVITHSMNQNTSNQNQPTDSDLAQKAIHVVQNYKGTDNNGLTVLETIAKIVSMAYPNEDIVHNPSTTMTWDALPSPTKGTSVYEVYFDIKTYKEKMEYFFYVNMNSSKIYAGNQLASDILNYVNTNG